MITKLAKSVLIFFITLIFFSCGNKQGNIASEPFKAIPIDAFAIVQLNHLSNTLEVLGHQTKFWKELNTLPGFDQLQTIMDTIESAARRHPNIHNNISRSPVLLSFHRRGNNSAEYAMYCPLRYPLENDLNELLKGQNVEAKTYEHIDINLVHLGDHRECCIALHDNMLFISSSLQLLEEVLRQTKQTVSLLNDTSFKKVLTSAGKKVEGNIFINYKQSKNWSMKYMSPAFKKTVANTEVPAEWSAMDIILEDEHLMLSGLTLTNNDNQKFLQVFQQQEPQEPTFISILPNTTSAFMFFGFNNSRLFYRNYHHFLDYNHSLSDYTKSIKELNLKLDFDAEKVFQDNSGGELAVCYTIGPDSSLFYIMKIQDKEKMISDFRHFVPEKKRTREKILDQVFEWFEMPQANIPEILFQNYFFKQNMRYAAFLDNYVIFATSKENLKDFIYLNLTGSKLIFSKDFERFNKNIPNKSNLLMYSNISIAKDFMNDIFNLKEKNSEWMKSFVHSNGACLQISSVGNGLYYTNFLIQFDKQDKSGPVLEWKYPLDSLSSMQPISVINHNSRQTEIMVQDLKKILYLIDAEGRMIWKKQLPEFIMGKISQIDYFRNNKLQYLFNTTNAMYLIDRNGDFVERFPVFFKIPATSPITIVDYEDTKEYRIFIALQDLNVYCLTKDGKIVDGWKPFKTEEVVIKPIQYLRLADKDYIVILDDKQPYFLNRKGEIRLRLSEPFKPSLNNNIRVQPKTSLMAEHFVLSDSLGQTRLIYASGQVKTLQNPLVSTSHFFDYEDINNDQSKDYLFFDHDKMWGYNQGNKLISSINMGLDVDNNPFFYKFDTLEIKMLVFSAKEKKAQVLTNDGRIWNNAILNNCSGPPLMQKINDKLYIFVSNSDGFLYCYTIR